MLICKTTKIKINYGHLVPINVQSSHFINSYHHPDTETIHFYCVK